MMTGGFAAMLLGIVLWAGFFTLLIWAIYTIAVSLGARKDAGLRAEDSTGSGDKAKADSAEELLRERFARGEIDAEEYERDLDVLRGGRDRVGVVE